MTKALQRLQDNAFRDIINIVPGSQANLFLGNGYLTSLEHCSYIGATDTPSRDDLR